jgi:multiple sugar transport system ATP-binding protein
MADVVLRNITKRFDRVTALAGVSFDIKDGELFVLLGPTGAGKTTTLRVIAGLERQDEGSVLLNGRSVDHLAPADRDVAFVFQQYSLYPTMTVYDNLAFPLRSPLLRTPDPEIRGRVGEIAEKLRITHLLDRGTVHLSGGEMQRVAIGRALVRDPALFLMDEPLSNLDFKLREALRIEIEHLQKSQGSTTLFVTHDQVEALTMADRVAVLCEGHIVQIGTPMDIYDRPATTFVAQLVGEPRINLIRASRQNGALHVVDSTISLPLPAYGDVPPALVLGVRPEDVCIHAGGDFSGRIVLIEPLGVETILHVRTGNRTLLSLIPGITDLRLGAEVRFDLNQERLHYFRPDGTRLDH